MAVPVYALLADLTRAAGGTSRLLELFDHDDDGTIDAGLTDEQLCEAEGMVNSYVRKVHTTPLVAPIPPSITTITADLAIYMVKGRRDALTEGDIERHTERVEWLQGIASGKIDLGVDPTTAASPLNKAGSTERPSSKAVSRKNLEGFT